MTSYPFEALSPALLYLFTRSFLESKFQLRLHHVLHLIPFLVYAFLLFPTLLLSSESKVLMLDSIKNSVWSDSALNIAYFIVHFSIHFAYAVATFIILFKFRDKIIRSKNKVIKWMAGLITFLLVFIIVKFTLAILFGMRLVLYDTISVYSMVISGVIVQCIAWIKLTSNKLPILKPSPDLSTYELKLLDDLMEKKKVYLEEDLTMGSISQRMGIGSGRISELFRHKYGKAFKEVIGEYRIAEAKRIIQTDVKNDKVNLLAVALDSGFNNKVSFYRVFKKITGKAPSEYVSSLKELKDSNRL